MKIKTVLCPIESAREFDKTVNDLIVSGWALRKRDIIGAFGCPTESFNTPIIRFLYAELDMC